jgi:hypothetical protein
MENNKHINALYAVLGFLKGLDTSQVHNDSIQPSSRKVSMSKYQYNDIIEFIEKNLGLNGK